MTREQFDELLFHVPDSDLYDLLAPFMNVSPIGTIPITDIEEIMISTAPAPAKLNQIMILIEQYKK